MKNKLFLALVVLISSLDLGAQIGVGTTSPNNSAMLDVSSSSKGVLFPRMTSIQRANISSPANGLYVFDTDSQSLWYYNGTLWVNTVSESSYGDVKSGFQTADHSGWIKLDGRAVSTLTSSQQAVAAALGFTVILPDASSAYLVQNGGGVGSVAGSNSVTLSQANLPNVNFTGTAATAGSHSHTVDPASVSSSTNGSHNHTGSTSTNGDHAHSYTDYYFAENNGANWGWAGSSSGMDWDNRGYATTGVSANAGSHNHTLTINANGDHAHTVDIPSTASSTTGDHTHSVSVSSGGSATPINIAPKSLTVNMFVYLGH